MELLIVLTFFCGIYIIGHKIYTYFKEQKQWEKDNPEYVEAILMGGFAVSDKGNKQIHIRKLIHHPYYRAKLKKIVSDVKQFQKENNKK